MTARRAFTACAPFIDCLVACRAPFTLSCTGARSISIVCDGQCCGGQNFTDIAGYPVVVNDGACDVHRRRLEALRVGDRCSAASSPKCAEGLTCSGICAKACTDDDCQAWADDCRLRFQHLQVCKSGKCTRSCSGDSASRVDRGCTLP